MWAEQQGVLPSRVRALGDQQVKGDADARLCFYGAKDAIEGIFSFLCLTDTDLRFEAGQILLNLFEASQVNE